MSPAPARQPPSRTKSPHDTAAWCRDRAEADLLASVTMAIANERIRLETSAASWSARADLLQRLDDSAAARMASEAALRLNLA